MKSSLTKFLQYYNLEIDGWDLISWAAEVDPQKVEDKESLDLIINLDDFYTIGYHEYVEDLIYKIIPEKDRKSKGEILILNAFSQLKSKGMSAVEFVSKFIEYYTNEIEDSNEACSDWIIKVFSENDGYGFLNMNDMSREDLANYIQKEIDSKTHLNLVKTIISKRS